MNNSLILEILLFFFSGTKLNISCNFRFSRSNSTLSVHCKQYVEMLEGNILAPYKFIHRPAEFQFSFNYVKINDCLPQISQLLRAATLPTAEQNAMVNVI